MRGYKPMHHNGEFADYSGIVTGDEKNWVKDGMVTRVKDQGACGSCWAFSAVGAIESANAISGKKLVELSEQQLVDCDREKGGNEGCNGGDMALAFEYVEKNPRESEADYGYEGKDGDCIYDRSKGVGTVSNYINVKPNLEAELKAAIAKGPVSVGIEADQLAFQLYFGGVISKANCGTDLDHGVLAVGYGSENGQDYYLVKNSWGPSWGMKGFVKIAAEDSGPGACGI